MKNIIVLAVISASVISSVYAHSRTRCRTTYDSWGNSRQVCRTVNHRHSSSGDAIIIGALAGYTAGIFASTCAPEVVNGNVSATDRALNEIAASKEFAKAEEFQFIVDQINQTKDTKEKMGLYFTLVDVKDSSEIAHFIGARDSELREYAQKLEVNADLSAEQADLVVTKLVQTLKGGLN
jgi:5'-3' exonuclease